MARAYVESAASAVDGSGAVDDIPWRYGWGSYDASAERVEFHRLPHFTGTAWQGGEALPDPKMGWVTLNATGGHPGNDPDHATVRRWLAPRAGMLSMTGTLKHASDQGDGVRGMIVSDRQGLRGQWDVFYGEAQTVVAAFAVAAGEVIDMLTTCRGGPSFDGFTWTVELRLADDEDGGRQAWSSSTGFRGPRPEPLGCWEHLAQVLLMTNEFTFID
jgi:hypothetical protein